MRSLSRLALVGSCCVLLSAVSGLHGQVVTTVIDENFDAELAFPAGWTGVTVPNTTVAVTEFGASGITVAGSAPNQVTFARAGNTLSSGATLSTTFTTPDSTYVTAANLSFDYALNLIGSGSANNITLEIFGATDPWVQTGAGAWSTGQNVFSESLLALFLANPNTNLELRFTVVQPTAAAMNPRNVFAIDNVLLTYTEVLPEPPGGGGSGASAAAVATMNANRRAQQQMQAHQARVARMQVAQQHRRNQQRR